MRWHIQSGFGRLDSSSSSGIYSYACSLVHSELSWWGLKSSLHLRVAHTHYGSHYSFRYFIIQSGPGINSSFMCLGRHKVLTLDPQFPWPAPEPAAAVTAGDRTHSRCCSRPSSLKHAPTRPPPPPPTCGCPPLHHVLSCSGWKSSLVMMRRQ
jgi:hypothetical protein